MEEGASQEFLSPASAQEKRGRNLLRTYAQVGI